MKFTTRDYVATVLVAAVAVHYVGYLVRGELSFVEDPRGMSATGLILGTIAYAVIRQGDGLDTAGKSELALAVASLALGVVALIFAEVAAAEALLALFMGSILVVWAVETTGVAHAIATNSARRRAAADVR